jgi:hypothetical protein
MRLLHKKNTNMHFAYIRTSVNIKVSRLQKGITDMNQKSKPQLTSYSTGSG